MVNNMKLILMIVLNIVLFTIAPVLKSEISYDFYKFSVATGKSSDGFSAANGYQFQRSFAESDDNAVVFSVGNIEVEDTLFGDNATNSFISAGFLFHPEADENIDFNLGLYLTYERIVEDTFDGTDSNDTALGYSLGIRSKFNSFGEFSINIEESDISGEDSSPLLILGFAYSFDKNNAFQFEYSDDDFPVYAMSYIYYLK